jgi:cell division protein ZapA (FtsZ GTPase activity inhibitor)
MTRANDPKNLFEVTIAGIPFKLRSGQKPEKVRELVSFVDKKVQEALPATKSGSIQNAALLALLNVAEEHFELKRRASEELDRFEKKTQRVFEDLEALKVSRMGLDN